MKTIEATYILPLIIAIICFFITLTFYLHDCVITPSLMYGILADTAQRQEGSIINPSSPLTKKEISSLIQKFYISSKRPSISCSLTGDTLYINNLSITDSIPVYFSNYERCDYLRKETAILMQIKNK